MPTFSVFTYGTLQLPSVMQAVTGQDLKPVVATLSGYQRFKFKGKTFPGIIKNETCSIEGMLYKNVDERTLKLLDQFEDVAYERCLVNVQVGKQIEKAFIYVTKGECRGWLSDKEWDLEIFKELHLEKYLKRIAGF